MLVWVISLRPEDSFPPSNFVAVASWSIILTIFLFQGRRPWTSLFIPALMLYIRQITCCKLKICSSSVKESLPSLTSSVQMNSVLSLSELSRWPVFKMPKKMAQVIGQTSGEHVASDLEWRRTWGRVVKIWQLLYLWAQSSQLTSEFSCVRVSEAAVSQLPVHCWLLQRPNVWSAK